MGLVYVLSICSPYSELLNLAALAGGCNDLLLLSMFSAFTILTVPNESVECPGVHILSTGGTAAKLRDLGCTVQALGFGAG